MLLNFWTNTMAASAKIAILLILISDVPGTAQQANTTPKPSMPPADPPSSVTNETTPSTLTTSQMTSGSTDLSTIESTSTVITQTTATIYQTMNTTNQPTATADQPNNTKNQHMATAIQPNNTTNQPEATANQTKNTTNQPTATTNQPNNTTKHPDATANQTKTTTNQPTATINQTKNTTNQPTATANQPNNTTNHPEATANQTKTTTNQPTDTTNQTKNTTNQPTATAIQPNNTTNQPTATANQTKNTTNQPTATAIQPNNTTNQPTATANQTKNTTNQPTATAIQPNNTTNQPEATTNQTKNTTNQSEATTNQTKNTPDEVTTNPNETTTITNKATTTTTTSTTKANRGVPTVPPEMEIVIANVEIKTTFAIKYDIDFNQDLKNTSSDEYKNKAATYKADLRAAYKDVTGFKEIIILGFREGSVVVDFNAVISYVDDKGNPHNASELEDELIAKVYPVILKQTAVNQTFLRDTFPEYAKQATEQVLDICKVQDICPSDYRCTKDGGKPVCEHKCSEKQNECQNGGYCVLDLTFQPVCRCPKEGNFVYGGDNCEVKAEKLILSKDYIIAIAAGGGGGVILILTIVIVVLLVRRDSLKSRQKKPKKAPDQASEQSFKSMKDSEDGLHQSYFGQLNIRGFEQDNPTFNRLSEVKAENLRFNPYYRNEVPIVDDLSNGFSYGNRGFGESIEMARRNTALSPKSPADTQLKPDYEPLGPRSYRAESAYSAIDDKDSPAVMYQPSKVMRPLSEYHPQNPLAQPDERVSRVYDYHREAAMARSASRPTSNAHLYDFEQDNNPRQSDRISDPYAIKRPRLSSSRRPI